MSDIAATAESPSRTPLSDEVARRRTFAIISHPDAGKTTLTEKLLLFGGAINLAGQVKAKGERRNTRSDWMKIERERGISVVTSVMTFEFEGLVFNLLDTPGHEDFSEDTYRTLTAVDSAVMVIDAAKGIEARTRKLFEVCRLRDIPIITFINKMDRDSRDTFDLLDEIEKTLALDTTPMTWPVGRGRDFLGTYDVANGGVRLLEGGAKTGAAQLRRRRFARWSRPLRAAAARAGFQSAQGRSCGTADERLRVQDPGQYGPEPSRPHRVCPFVFGKTQPRHEGKTGAHRQEHVALQSAVLLRAGSGAGGRGLCRRRRRHSQSRHAADRRHPDRRRGSHFPRRAELRAGNRPPGAADRRDEGEEAQRGAAADVGGGRRAGVSAARRRAGPGRRGRSAPARRAQGAARRRICPAGRIRGERVSTGALDIIRRSQEARRVHRRQRLRRRRRCRRRSGVPGQE